MTKLIYISALLLMTGAQAYAANDSISQFEHHASAGQLEVTPILTERFRGADAKDSTTAGFTSLNSAGTLLHVTAEYGVIPQLAIGADIGFSTDSLKLKGGTADGHRTNYDGFDDILLYGRGHVALATGSIAYGLNLDVATEKATEDSHGNSNSSTGGYYFQPYVGYEAKTVAGLFGGQFNYTFQGNAKLKDESTSPTTESTTKGGDKVGVSLFYEYQMPVVTFGGAFIYEHQANSKTDGVNNNNHVDQVGFRFYTPVRLAKNIELLPQLQWLHYSGFDSSVPLKNVNEVALQIAARFAF